MNTAEVMLTLSSLNAPCKNSALTMSAPMTTDMAMIGIITSEIKTVDCRTTCKTPLRSFAANSLLIRENMIVVSGTMITPESSVMILKA